MSDLNSTIDKLERDMWNLYKRIGDVYDGISGLKQRDEDIANFAKMNKDLNALKKAEQIQFDLENDTY